MTYAELHCISHYSFLRGASSPAELVTQAAQLGYRAIALTDECSLAGIVKAHVAAKEQGIQLIVGSEFALPEQGKLVALVPERRAYGELSALITRCRRRSAKGSYQLEMSDFEFSLRHCLLIWLPPTDEKAARAQGQQLKAYFPERLWLGVTCYLQADYQAHYLHCYQLAKQLDLSMLACGDVHMHQAQRKPLLDTVAAIRLNRPIAQLGTQLQSNAQRYLRPLHKLAAIYPKALLEESVRLSERCHFSLDELAYQYPKELVPEHLTPIEYLRQLVAQGASQRWPQGAPTNIQQQIEKELQLIQELSYEYYFLTVFDIVCFARAQRILCQGRGSAANSVVCYCLFITQVNPEQTSLLFERFISKERNEPPDIDVDFEHERREEVIQYIYKKYSRERTALAATLITYRPRSAVRDVGKALGLDPLFVDQLAKSLAWWDRRQDLQQRFQSAQLNNPRLADQFMQLINEILGTPRHLSQHVGGFIICDGPISQLVPVENASMPERTVIQWDKEDIEALGLLKVDILALGMLSAIRKSLDLINQYQPLSITDIPQEQSKPYELLCQGDSLGVFQVESRAQMSMLPRLKPRNYYDLVIQVAIVRPGPIQGDMVHPYLRRRDGVEPVHYENPAVEEVLKRTLGVPIFQEQVIKLAMVAAGFSGGEADQLRRAMASWGRNGNLLKFREKLLFGMRERGYSQDFAERLFNQMKGFGSYGFPESHAASFALLVYLSAWLKAEHPSAFYCALLNSQPMGFYSPSQLIQDARRHQIRVHPVDVDHSTWDCTLEDSNSMPTQQPALRLGLRYVKGFNEKAAQRLVTARAQAVFDDWRDLCRRAQLNQQERNCLIQAGALIRLAQHRHQAHWQDLAIEQARPLFLQEPATPHAEASLDDAVTLTPPSLREDLRADYQSLGFTLNPHPMALLRAEPTFRRCTRATDLIHIRHGRFVRVAGIVTGRQRPGTASGVIFLTLEDETGNLNIIVWRNLQERFRQALLTGKLLLIKGVLERKASVAHVIAGEIIDQSDAVADILLPSRDFH